MSDDRHLRAPLEPPEDVVIDRIERALDDYERATGKTLGCELRLWKDGPENRRRFLWNGQVLTEEEAWQAVGAMSDRHPRETLR